MYAASSVLGQKRVVVTLGSDGSGGIQCAAALGLAKVLAREHIAIDQVIGSNGASLFAAVMALGLPTHQAAACLSKLWCHGLTRQRDERAVLHDMLRAMLSQSTRLAQAAGTTDDHTVMQQLAEAFGDVCIEDTAIPLQIKATDPRTGAQAVFTRGRLADVVRASNRRPFTCEPWMVDDRTYAGDFLSASQTSRLGASADIVLALNFANPAEETGEALPAYAALHLGERAPSSQRLGHFERMHPVATHRGDPYEVMAVVPTFAEPIGRFDNSKIASIVAQGERATEAILPQLRERLARPKITDGRRLAVTAIAAPERQRTVATTHDGYA